MNHKRGYPAKCWSDRAILMGANAWKPPIAVVRATVDPIDDETIWPSNSEVFEELAYEDFLADTAYCEACGGPRDGLGAFLTKDEPPRYVHPPVPSLTHRLPLRRAA